MCVYHQFGMGSTRRQPPHTFGTENGNSLASLPISSNSDVIDLERKEMAGGGNRLVCCGAAKVKKQGGSSGILSDNPNLLQLLPLTFSPNPLAYLLLKRILGSVHKACLTWFLNKFIWGVYTIY